jgi:hypothetical protein
MVIWTLDLERHPLREVSRIGKIPPSSSWNGRLQLPRLHIDRQAEVGKIGMPLETEFLRDF